MIHHIAQRKSYRSALYKFTCTKAWTKVRMEKKSKLSLPKPVECTSSLTKVTCPKCLEILIPKEEAKLEQMKKTYKQVDAIELYQNRAIGAYIEHMNDEIAKALEKK